MSTPPISPRLPAKFPGECPNPKAPCHRSDDAKKIPPRPLAFRENPPSERSAKSQTREEPDEAALRRQLQGLEAALLEQETRRLLADPNLDLDIDLTSVAKKAKNKLAMAASKKEASGTKLPDLKIQNDHPPVDKILGKESRIMKKDILKKNRRRTLTILAASLVLICGVATAYGSEISGFFQSLLGKTVAYSGVVEGPSYYLETPLDLGPKGRLIRAMVANGNLELQFDRYLPEDQPPKIRSHGIERSPDGFGGEQMMFYDVEITDHFELILEEESYPVALTPGDSVLDDTEITQLPSDNIDWLSLGYKPLENGFQLLATGEDPSLQFLFFQSPETDLVTQLTDKTRGETRYQTLLPMEGHDSVGTLYRFQHDPYDLGIPLTKFTLDSSENHPEDPALPDDLILPIPEVAVQKELNQDIKIKLPEEGSLFPAQEIDLGLQKMLLEEVRRIDETTVNLSFRLNTGDQEHTRIWHAHMDERKVNASETRWENGRCEMKITSSSHKAFLKLRIYNAAFLVRGDWQLRLGE